MEQRSVYAPPRFATSRGVGKVFTLGQLARCYWYKGCGPAMRKHVLGWLGIAVSTWMGYALLPDTSAPTTETCLATAECVDIALDFVPGVNVVKDLLSVGLGVNPVTGEAVDNAETALLLSLIVFPWATRRAVRAIEPRVDVLQRLRLRLRS